MENIDPKVVKAIIEEARNLKVERDIALNDIDALKARIAELEK